MICSVVGLFVFIPSVCLCLFTCLSVRLFVLFVTLFCFGLFVCLFVFCFVCVFGVEGLHEGARGWWE